MTKDVDTTEPPIEEKEKPQPEVVCEHYQKTQDNLEVERRRSIQC